MLSRVAESIYWMSRQVERAENLARFLEVTHNLILDQPEIVVDPWEPLIEATGDAKLYQSKYKQYDAESVTQFLAFDTEYPNSMLSSLRMGRQNARGARESLSSETFEQLNDFYHFVKRASESPALDSETDFFDAVRRIAIQWTGVLDSTMPRDIGWHFANVGRLIERADKTSRILDVKYFNLLPSIDDVGTAVDDMQWSALLQAISGLEAFRRQWKTISIERVVEFSLFNEDFPRSVLFCVGGADWSLSKIEEMSRSKRLGIASEKTVELRRRLSLTSVQEVLAGGMHENVDRLQSSLNEIGNALNEDYFHLPGNA